MTTDAKPQNLNPIRWTLGGRFNRMAKEAVLSMLASMPIGRYDMRLPDGTLRTFGDSSASPQGIITVHDDEFFVRCMLFADLGLAESYLDGICDISNIRGLISWILLNHSQSPVLNESDAQRKALNILGHLNRMLHKMRHNSVTNSRRNISEHYDLGNDFFSTFLDSTMTYSSAYFVEPSMQLQNAQIAKFKRAAGMLRIKATDRVLDLGCGWGGLTTFIAREFGCQVTAVTISEQQHEYVQKLLQKEGLTDRVELKLTDYRNLTGTFDKIVSIEMIEAVGEEYIDTFIAKLDSLLARDGLLLMQMITFPDARYELLRRNVDFIQKHIFPGSLLQSLARIGKSMQSCGELFMIDLFDMTPSYVLTLKQWQTAFESKLAVIRELGFDERFIRKYRYYFEYCQAAFDMRNISVVQATYSRPNNLNLRMPQGE